MRIDWVIIGHSVRTYEHAADIVHAGVDHVAVESFPAKNVELVLAIRVVGFQEPGKRYTFTVEVRNPDGSCAVAPVAGGVVFNSPTPGDPPDFENGHVVGLKQSFDAGSEGVYEVIAAIDGNSRSAAVRIFESTPEFEAYAAARLPGA